MARRTVDNNDKAREGAMRMGTTAASRFLARLAGAALAAAALLASLHAPAQPAAWTAKCSGCHGADAAAILLAIGGRPNGANAGALLEHVIANGATNGTSMSGIAFAAGELADITGYLESVFNTTPMGASPAFQSSAAVSLANKVVMGTTPTGLNVLESVSGPGKGSVSYNAGAPSFTYTAGSCQTGSDSFTYRARNTTTGVTTSTRTVNVTIGNPVTGPTFNSATSAPATTESLFSYTATVSTCPSLVTWSLPSAPAWLSLNPSTGVVSGTPPFGTQGTSPAFTVRATYPGGASADRVVTVNVSLGAPTVTSSATAPNGAVGIAYPGYPITATNGPPFVAFGATGLPPGLTVNAATGLISGTPSTAGSYNASVTAQNAAGTSTPKAVSFSIAAGSPVITSAASASGQTGIAFGYQIAATNSPTSYSATGLPPGVSLNASTGLISGVPTATGSFNVTLGATNGTGTGNLALTITVTLGPPVITSAASASAGVAAPFTYQITATNSPTSFNATGLPPGLSINAATGVISGSPTAAGTFVATISATNAVPLTGSASLTIDVATIAPVLNSPTTASGQTGVPFTYQITALNGPTSFAATGLPPGLSLNTATGLVSGTPTAAGTFVVTITASNGAGSSAPQPTTITIALGPPVVTSPATASGAASTPFAYQITASNAPTSFAATGLPPGLSLNAATGLISGTPTANGAFAVTISASNATGTGTLVLTLTIAVGPPVISSPAAATGVTDLPFTYQITASGAPTAFAAAGLPPGLALNATTGLIYGTPTTPGSFATTVSATNATGTGTRALAITITLAAPVITSPATAAATSGQPFSYQVTGTSGPTNFAATGLPPGLSINAATGLISGTPTAGGTFRATISATNAAGTSTQELTLTIAYVAPSVRDLVVEVAFQQPTPIVLPVTGQFTQVTIVERPANGTLSAIPAGGATVSYTSRNGYSGSDRFTYTATGPGGTSAVATVTITVPTFRPVAAAATLTVTLNTPARLDLAPFITGSAVTGVAIAREPRHGRAAVDGKTVTYTPNADYFGADTFQYVAFGNAGKSEPATVEVTIVGRPDPSKDATVVGLVDAQGSAARRFSRAQVANYQRRLETLHVAGTAAGNGTAEGARPAGAAQPTATAPGGGSSTAAAPTAATGPAATALAGALASAAASQSVNLSSVTASPATKGAGAWAGGTASFGRRSREEEGTTLDFSTEGITVGADRRVNDRVALGLGLGYARDRTDIGAEGSRSKAEGASLAGYGSYQPTRETFVDAVLGFGKLDFDSDRHVAALDEVATGRRKGRQVFGALAAGYERRHEGLLFSPYGRLDFSFDRLEQSTESGAGLAALTYHEQSLRSVQAAAGLRLETRQETRFGWAQPRLRLEYRHEFEDARAATLAYADGYEGRTYTVTPSGSARNFLLLGAGVDFLLRSGLRLGFEYQGERASGPGTSQSVRFLLSQELDGLGRGANGWQWRALDEDHAVNAEIGFLYDDNVSRGRLPEEKLSDRVYTLGLSTSRTFPITANSRAIATALFNVDKFHDNTGLGRTSGGLQGDLQYRASGDFNAVTYALFARAWIDGYESSLRSGSRYSLGINARRSLTDRIDAFGEAASHWRRAESDVFAGRDWSARLNLDYGLGAAGTAYLAGEYRRGDTFASGVASLWNLNAAEVFVRDDAFERNDFFAYRFEARTLLGTLGFNRPLGPHGSLDLSYRRVQTTPLAPPGGSGPTTYRVNQYAILYLMRF